MKDYPLYIAVGKRYAFVPGADSVRVEGGVGTISGGEYDGAKVEGVTGAACSASFFSKHKGYEEVRIGDLLPKEGDGSWE